ncbi:biotin carboxyl carrier protein of acetyl-CoA carboxylase [Filimonas sp.]|jgi:acetyl-CoA carboxylase biotin carboxyl carrier protein|nr:biotin carboxyl carrier protein of acetyl-CoA carboxylase [Filimonas sp.]
MAKAKKAAPKKAAPQKAASKKSAAPVAVKSAAPKSSDKSPAPVFNINEINELINAVNHSNVNELKLEKGDFKITIRQGGEVVSTKQTVVHAPVHAAPAAPVHTAPAAPAAAPVAEASTENLHTIKSPMIGTFYRSSGPGKPVFVNVGDDIKVGDVLCIVEAMKLFNEIESEVSGKVVKMLVDDTSPVEYDQPLFLVQLS